MTTARDRSPVATGGCQCGLIRFEAYAVPSKVGLCHCRMCQRALGAPFGVFAVFADADFTWTKGLPKSFASSNRAFRDFCGDCGTPLSFRPSEGGTMEMMSGSLDDPSIAVPTYEVGRESKLHWISSIVALPGRTTVENMGAEQAAAVKSNQQA